MVSHEIQESVLWCLALSESQILTCCTTWSDFELDLFYKALTLRRLMQENCSPSAVFMCWLSVFSGEPSFYPRVLSLCRALSQYLLIVSQLPSSLHIPSDKEHLITTFTCTAAEVKKNTLCTHFKNTFKIESCIRDFSSHSSFTLVCLSWPRWSCGVSFRTACPWVWTCSGRCPAYVFSCSSPASGTNCPRMSTSHTPAPSSTAYVSSLLQVRRSQGPWFSMVTWH